MKSFKPSYFLLCLCISSQSIANITTHFDTIKSNPNALYAFFKAMPKGGELHYHYTGGAYPETMLMQATKANYCIDSETFTLSANTGICTGVATKDLMKNEPFYNQTIRAWSMKDFIPGKESAHDHFFSSFQKFGSVTMDYHGPLLAEIMQRAADQHELYLELQLFNLPHDANYDPILQPLTNLADKKQALMKNPQFQNNVNDIIKNSKNYLTDARHELGCNESPQNAACAVTVKFQCFVKRAEPINSVFSQALACFAATAESDNIVGVNLVQAEDGIIPLKDYNAHMEIFKFLHAAWPNVHIALHAGELAPQAVTPENLRFHIHNAIFTGFAERIGHGVDIAYEDNSVKLLQYMAQKPVPVEINLTSNHVILNVFGKQHPLRLYLNHHVPVVLSTDDEGILRTDLTRQYVQAAFDHHLDYPTIKRINRNALTYSFLPGKSLWADPVKFETITACKDLNSDTCKHFIQGNEKAKLQWALEKQLSAFEDAIDNLPHSNGYRQFKCN